MIVLEDSHIKPPGYFEAELKLEIAVMLFEKEKLPFRKATGTLNIIK